jgi:FecR protein
MLHRMMSFGAPFLLVALVISCVGMAAIAEDAVWRVNRSSGDVWLTTSGVQQISVTTNAIVKPGDKIHTGQNGRVLLARGKETILISPNSVVGIPKDKKDGMATTLIQQAGSILFEVEKRNHKHFKVETPFLAAVVKGTQFRVTVNKSDARVDVFRGEVEVTDFKSGQYALVLPGQTAKVSTGGTAGLFLSGSGILRPIRRGDPRASSVLPARLAENGSLVPDIANIEQQPRVASQPAGLDAVPTSSERTAAKENGWAFGLKSLDKLFGNGQGNRDNNLIVAIPLAVGFAVSVAVAAQRRRKKQKQKPM